MSAHRNLDRLIQSFLAEGPMELPDPSYDQVRDRMEETRQRAFIGPWRTSDVSKNMKYGLAAAAVVVVAIVGYQFLGNSNTGGPGATATPQPTATPEPTTTPQAGLPVGSSHVLLGEGVTITVTIPAAGWFGEVRGGILVKNDDVDPPDGAGMIVFTGPLYVYGDPCQWSTTRPAAPATTVDEFVAAMAAQASRDASDAVNFTVGGYAGKSITLHVPDDAVFGDCDQNTFGSWGVPGDDPARFSQGPGQIDELYILDVGGVLMVIDTGYYAGTPAEVVDEIRAIVESATFELP